jgi:enoyl-[acyl-carrier protein] reductase I
MDCSCFSFIEMARLAAPLMSEGGTLFTMSYHGAHRVVESYNVMGPVKAALEASVRYLAHELGRQGIRVHTISPGPIRTRAASGLADFDELIDAASRRAPAGAVAGIEDVGYATAMLAVDQRAAHHGLHHLRGRWRSHHELASKGARPMSSEARILIFGLAAR